MPDIRRTALNALDEICLKGRKPKDALESLSGGLDRRDRAFLMELVCGVLRHKDTLDWILKNFLEKPSKLNSGTVDNLRLGVYQIFYLRVPEWASVNEAVELEKSKPALVNAVLRNILREFERIRSDLKAMKEDIAKPSTADSLRVSYISTLTSHPKWLIKRWIKRFGLKEAFELAAANNKIPSLTLRVNTLKAQRAEVLQRLESMGIEAEPTPLSPDGIKLKGALAFSELEGLKGYITAQDEAAQLVTYMLDPQPGERVLDACAAPGGKTTHIAQLMRDTGEIIAVDNDEKRIATLRENIKTLGISSVKIVKTDMLELKSTIGALDRVMLDAPCSATGVIRRNPDVKYRHRAGDLLRFKQKQREMLRSVSALLKPGGTLLYCTCSTEPEEGEDVIREFLKTSRNFDIIKGAPFAENGFLRTYPHRHDMDGFFGARIYKNL